MAIKIEMLRCFSTVAQTGNLAEAANRLGRTPSAISMTLKQLEDHLGQRLFASDRKNRLTPLGAYVLEHARSELRQFDSTIRAIEAYAVSPKGLIQIAAVPSIAAMIFPGLIEDFAKLHPGVSVEIRDMDSANILDALTRGQIDIGIAASSGVVRGVTQARLFSDAFGLFCSQSHPLAQETRTLSLADLAGQDLVRNELCARITHPGFQLMLNEARVSAQNTLSLISMVRSDNWVTVLPRAVVNIAPDYLAFRPLSDLQEFRTVDLLMRTDRMDEPFVSDFASLVQDRDWSLWDAFA